MNVKKFKNLNVAMSLLLLSACFDDNNDTACTAPTYNNDGSLLQLDYLNCYTPQDMHSAYELNTLYDMNLTGNDMTIVIHDAYGSPTAEEDFTVFHNAFFPNRDIPEFKQIYPSGMPSEDGDWEGEISLDIQWSHAIAPDANIHLISTLDNSFEYMLIGIEYIVDNYPPGTVVSMSWGANETDYSDEELAGFEAAFKTGTENGITFFASSGDEGSNDGADVLMTDYPASSPYVTAVGGTFLQYGWEWVPLSNNYLTDSDETNYDYFNFKKDLMFRLETPWNESWLSWASGGGSSTLFDIPEWQSSVADHIYAQSGSGRGIPDLAWNASAMGGVLVYDVGNWEVWTGTSAASPQIAGLFALINQYLAEQGMDYVAHLNPWLYQIDDDTAFNDILPVSQGTVLAGEQVNNQTFEYLDDGTLVYSDVPGYPTTEGWDMTTGFGSPRGKNFLDALVTVMSENN
ncbi:S53 family peptidase [uncultured Shewanella sp.]|uniref:S53 family peptidase n=1 Tax=uncultured Shewanella sp. TaxID=173975 RepID=UPI002603422A|nr:S53 family peptidase [uncultured Shewanella sp.]